MAVLKIGRKIFDIDENDIVLFNGACWQLISRRVRIGRDVSVPIVSKIMCEKFVKKGILVMYKKADEYVTTNGSQMGLYYYKFDMDKLNEFVNKN